MVNNWGWGVGRSIPRGAGDVGGRGVGRLGIGGGIGRLAGIHNIGDIAAVGVRHLVVDGLEATVGQRHRVGADGGVAVPLLPGVDLDAVVVVNAVVVGVHRRLVVYGGGGVAVERAVVGNGHSGEGGKSDDDL